MKQAEQVPTMEDLLAQLKPGGTLSWTAVQSPRDIEERFFRVYQNWNYNPGRFTWENQVDIHTASRRRPRTLLSEITPPRISFDGSVNDVVDFYGTSRAFSFLSRKLFEMLVARDPESIEGVGVSMKARDGILPFHALLPTRSVAAIDVARTNIVLSDQNIMDTVVPRWEFPNGIVFNNDKLGDATNFFELDTGGWYWSGDLLHQAKSAGVRGLYAVSKSEPRDRDYISL